MHELNLLAFFSRLLFVWENRGGGGGGGEGGGVVVEGGGDGPCA